MKGKRRRPNRPRRRRRRTPWYFRLILVLFPFVLLALVEGLLRLGGIESPPPLFLTHTVAGIPYLQPNPAIGDRFFPRPVASIMPRPNFQVLPAEKREGTRRILCLGESTTAGFPFPVHGAFPAFLQMILEERAPGERWEVTNCGLPAISASSVAELCPEILETNPDALVVYLGHNEFYGAGGVASQGTGIGRYLEHLRALRIVRVMERLLPTSRGESEPGTLMQRMARQATIPPDSPLRERASRNFRRDLTAIVDAANRNGVKVILCEVVSNERDHYPFGSAGAVETSLGGIGLAVAKWSKGRPSVEEASILLAELDREIDRDSLHAGLRFLRGVARLAVGDSGGACDLRDARNLDAIPFRAPDAINGIVREVAEQGRADLVAMERIFREGAAEGIPGEESFVEHLHPTLLGTTRIASAVADVLLGQPFTPVREADAGRWVGRSGLTRVDLSFADARIAQLLARWPYRRRAEEASPFGYDVPSVRAEAGRLLAAAGDSAAAASLRAESEEEQRLVRALLAHQADILGVHRRLGRAAAERNDLEEAAREFLAAALLFPVDPAIWIDLGQVRWRLGDRRGAVQAARTALAWDPTAAGALDLLRQTAASSGS